MIDGSMHLVVKMAHVIDQWAFLLFLGGGGISGILYTRLFYEKKHRK